MVEGSRAPAVAEEMPDLPVVIGRGPPDEVQPVGHSRVTMTQLMAPQDTTEGRKGPRSGGWKLAEPLADMFCGLLAV